MVKNYYPLRVGAPAGAALQLINPLRQFREPERNRMAPLRQFKRAELLYRLPIDIKKPDLQSHGFSGFDIQGEVLGNRVGICPYLRR